MKDIFSGFCTAFSMYSVVPMPQLEWNKKTMRYAMCFFPFVGILIGLLSYGFNFLAIKMNFQPLFYSAIMVVIPIFISGAIHLDGLIDTSDARYSRQEMSRKLEILKDPHVGAFGVIVCVIYLILSLGLYFQFYANPKHILIVSLGFILSRTMSALSIVSFKTAKNTGLAHIFSDNADRGKVGVFSLCLMTVVFAIMLVINPLVASIVMVISVLWFWLYKRMCYKEFGGITGDLAGFFLQIHELIILGVAVLGAYL